MVRAPTDWGEISSTVNEVPLHTTFHYQPLFVLIWLNYCWKGRETTSQDVLKLILFCSFTDELDNLTLMNTGLSEYCFLVLRALCYENTFIRCKYTPGNYYKKLYWMINLFHQIHNDTIVYTLFKHWLSFCLPVSIRINYRNSMTYWDTWIFQPWIWTRRENTYEHARWSANSADHNQTAPRGAVWSWSTLFVNAWVSCVPVTLRESDLFIIENRLIFI